jgi:hypothetical protein
MQRWETNSLTQFHKFWGLNVLNGKTVCLFIQKKFITMYLPGNKWTNLYVSLEREIRKILQTHLKIFLNGSIFSPIVCYLQF